MAHFNRERVPERNVHAKGGGAFGHFVTTHDVSGYTKAALFQPGVSTEALLRFSTVAGEAGSADTVRDPRGFAMKFYTCEGNYDLVGNNTPVFFIRDAIKFPHFIRSQKRLADKHTRDNDMQWDFWTLNPESAHQVTLLMSDRGTPASWRHMNGYGSHTYMWVNASGERFWVKYHFKTDQGIANFTREQAGAHVASDPDYHLRDLYEAIEGGNPPTWTLKIQVMPYEDAKTYRLNPFDLTKVWPHSDYPLITVGTLTLDRNPTNYFAQIEQAAFEPGNIVPGIGLSPDKMLLGRVFAYPDTHRYRIGPNYMQLPVNQPKVPVNTYTFDGAMRFLTEEGAPVYAPNSRGRSSTNEHDADPYADLVWETDGTMVRSAYTLRPDDDDFTQPGNLIREVLTEAERANLVGNVVDHASQGVSAPVLERVIAYWKNIDKRTGDDIEASLRG
jgi:catalase